MHFVVPICTYIKVKHNLSTARNQTKFDTYIVSKKSVKVSPSSSQQKTNRISTQQTDTEGQSLNPLRMYYMMQHLQYYVKGKRMQFVFIAVTQKTKHFFEEKFPFFVLSARRTRFKQDEIRFLYKKNSLCYLTFLGTKHLKCI